MRFKTLGKTGFNVSELCLGTWAIGGSGWGETNKNDCLEAIRTMIENGVNMIDTAPAYNAGVSEQIVGEAIRGIRDKVYLVTKTGTWFINGAYVRTLQKEKILQQCDMSLNNLGVDCIDLYLIHWPDPNVPIGETMDVLEGLKKQGKIRHIGVSNFTKEMILEAEQYGSVDVVQMQYSMVKRDTEEFLKWVHDRGLGVMTYGSLGAGILSGEIRSLPDYPDKPISCTPQGW
jgi:aryl-alcohol dehydrogenase-like predicted oxidoreductase